jgi:hypothetical protein
MNAAMGAAPWVARTRHDYARMLLARAGGGQEANADDLLEHALDAYRSLGMTAWAQRASEDRAGRVPDRPSA